ncbi:prophage tail fiber N-terminal domain-containing protein [Serratia proteamaculans]|uniref:prophage tail fiber N-terminal domain-containing protein n=1 Tax=Serratia proteamaculans TaxID=28151 RepID=UPI0039BEB4D6
MAVLISGKLIGPNGDPRPGVTIMLTAVKTSSAVVQLAPSSSTTGADGSYSLSVEVGTHNVMIEAYGRPFEKVGQITVYSDSKPGTLNAFLNSPGQDELSPAIVAIVDEMRAAAAAYAEVASDAAMRAKVSAENAQNIADANTYYITPEDPDGTIAGLAGTPNGKSFRVGQGPGKGLKTYMNVNGVAVEISASAGANSVTELQTSFHDYSRNNNYLHSELYTDVVSSIDFNDIGNINLGDTSLIRITDLNTHDAFLSTIQFSQVSSSTLMKRWYLPNHTQYANGVISSNYQPFYFSEISLNEFTELTDRYARVRYKLPDRYNLINENNRYRVVDTSGVFKPSFAESLTSETVSSISAHATKNIVQFLVVLSEIVREGYQPNQAGVLSFIADKADGALMMAYSGTYGSYVLRENQFDIIIPSGEYSIDVVGDVGVAATIRQRNQLKFVPEDKYIRKVADVINNTELNFTQYPIELKCTFEEGEAPSSSCLILHDEKGNNIDCQFAGEYHTNLRKQLDIGKHTDGSLKSGSVFFNADIAAGKQLYVQLNAHSTPQTHGIYPKLVAVSDGYDMTVGGNTFQFRDNSNFLLGAIVDKNGVVHGMSHFAVFRGLVSGVEDLTRFSYKPIVRQISTGPVFSEVEVIVYNSEKYGLEAGVLKLRVRYRIFKSGQVQCYGMCIATKEIPVGKLYGFDIRFQTGDKTFVADDKYKTALTPATGTFTAPMSLTVVRACGDTHRSGTQYGPTRPITAAAGGIGTGGVQMYAGWRYPTTSDTSFLNWPVEKDWAWPFEFWLDCNEKQDSPRNVAIEVFNRPVGFLGAGAYPIHKRKQIFPELSELSESILEFWDDAAKMPDYYDYYVAKGGTKTSYHRPYTTEIIKFIRYRNSTFQKLFGDFKNYLNANFGPLANLGDNYLSERYGLEFAATCVIPPLQWMYFTAVKENDAAAVTELKAGIKNFADALVDRYNAIGGIPLRGKSPTDIGNSNAMGMRVLGLAIYAGMDTGDVYKNTFAGVLNRLSTVYQVIPGIVTDSQNASPATDLWLPYQSWIGYFLAFAYKLVGRSDHPIDNVNLLLRATSGSGALRELDYCWSESRRGQPPTIAWVMAILLMDNRQSTVNAAVSLSETFKAEFGPRPGYPGRFYGYSNNTSEDSEGKGRPGTNIPYLASNLSDLWLYYYFYQGSL